MRIRWLWLGHISEYGLRGSGGGIDTNLSGLRRYSPILPRQTQGITPLYKKVKFKTITYSQNTCLKGSKCAWILTKIQQKLSAYEPKQQTMGWYVRVPYVKFIRWRKKSYFMPSGLNKNKSCMYSTLKFRCMK